MNRRLPSRRTRVGSPGEAAVPAVEPGAEPAPSKPASLARGAAGHPDPLPLRAAPVGAHRDAPRDINVFMPTGFEPGYAYPLLVWLPDPRGPAFDLGRVMSRVSLRNHVAVEPRGAVGDRETLVWQAIDRISDRVRIDPRRIFLLGQGSGGTEAFRIACRHATAFAGVASIGGPFPHGEGLFARLDDVRRLPMLLCCRQQATEHVLRPTDATLRLFHAAGAMLAMRIYPGRHDLSKTILADVNRWLMDEICGANATRQLPCRR